MDRKQFWRKKYIDEHRFYLILGLVISIVLVYFIGRRGIITLSALGWAIVYIVVIVFDIFNFIRHMNDYVNAHLIEEEQRGLQKDGFGTVAKDDPRFEDAE